jgi:uncharacterized protein (TIGR00725 family)
MRISVIGGGRIGDEDTDVAYRVGRLVGERDHTLVCGGRGGVMEAACRGTKEAGGRTIGILPGDDAADANAHVDVPIVTSMGNARNVLVVLNGEGAIAIDGAYGTLSEIAHALDLGRPVAGIRTHAIEGVKAVDSPEAAVEHVESAVR